MVDFDQTSTEAMVWAQAFVDTKREEGWELDDIDEGLMVSWFANYWAAVHDPLQAQVAELEKDRDVFRRALIFAVCELIGPAEPELQTDDHCVWWVVHLMAKDPEWTSTLCRRAVERAMNND